MLKRGKDRTAPSQGPGNTAALAVKQSAVPAESSGYLCSRSRQVTPSAVMSTSSHGAPSRFTPEYGSFGLTPTFRMRPPRSPSAPKHHTAKSPWPLPVMLTLETVGGTGMMESPSPVTSHRGPEGTPALGAGGGVWGFAESRKVGLDMPYFSRCASVMCPVARISSISAILARFSRNSARSSLCRCHLLIPSHSPATTATMSPTKMIPATTQAVRSRFRKVPTSLGR